MSEQQQLFEDPVRPRREKSRPKAAWPINFELQIERVVAMLEELHSDHWPRWLVHVIGLVRVGDPWITIEAGQLDPACSFSIAIDRPYRSYCPIAAALIDQQISRGEGP